MKKISIPLFLMVAILSYSQNSSILSELNHSIVMSGTLLKVGAEAGDNGDYEGSPFLENNFLPAKIKGQNGIFLLRYNIYNDEMILKDKDEYFKIPKEGTLNYFILNNEYIIRLIDGGFYIQVSDEKNNWCVVKKETIKFVPAKPSENNYQQARPARFSSNKPAYYLYNSEKNNLISLKSEEIVANFPDKENEIKQFLKKNKLKSANDYNLLIDLIAK